MKKLLLLALVLVIYSAEPVFAQSATISCTDATMTNCTIKKNQPFSVGADPALATDSIATEKHRLYLDGAGLQEKVNTGAAPVFSLPAGISVAGEHTLFLEALATQFNASGQPEEISSGPSNVVRVNIVTGSLSAPKNLKVQGGGQ